MKLDAERRRRQTVAVHEHEDRGEERGFDVVEAERADGEPEVVEGGDEAVEDGERREDVPLLRLRVVEVVVAARLHVVRHAQLEQDDRVHRVLHHHDLRLHRELPESWQTTTISTWQVYSLTRETTGGF